MHGSAIDEDPPYQQQGEKDPRENIKVPKGVPNCFQAHVKKGEKMAIQETIVVMTEHLVKPTKTVNKSKAVKLTILQGLLLTMNKLVKKL